MRILATSAAFACLLVSLAVPPAAAEPQQVQLEATAFPPARLTVAGPEGEATYDQVALEALGTYRIETVTPWRDQPAVFEGALLADVLAASGLTDAPALRVTAENDYVVDIPREVWADRPLLIATRVDGRAHSRRARGPLQFVFPMSQDPTVGDPSFETNWVWMVARIEPAD